MENTYMVQYCIGLNETTDSYDYSTIASTVMTIEGVKNLVEKHKFENGNGDDDDYLYRVTEFEPDDEAEGGCTVVNSMNYEEWKLEH